MTQTRHRAHLPLKALQNLGPIRKMREQNLYHHVAAQSRILRAVDLSHPARTERRQDFVGTQFYSWFEGPEFRDYNLNRVRYGISARTNPLLESKREAHTAIRCSL